MFVLAPIAPGRKNIMVSYRLPVAVNQPQWLSPVDSFDLLVEEPGATVSGAGLTTAAPVELMGSTLRRWTAAPPTGGSGEVKFGAVFGLGSALYWLVGVVGLLLLGGAGLAFRRARRTEGIPAVAAPVDLIGELARLDAKYAGREDDVPKEEWTAYEAERARLKSAALARGRSRP